MGCFRHCEFEDAKEMYMNARALFERPSTVVTSLAQMKSPGVSTGGRPGFSKVSSPDLASASSPLNPASSPVRVNSSQLETKNVWTNCFVPVFCTAAHYDVETCALCCYVFSCRNCLCKDLAVVVFNVFTWLFGIDGHC